MKKIIVLFSMIIISMVFIPKINAQAPQKTSEEVRAHDTVFWGKLYWHLRPYDKLQGTKGENVETDIVDYFQPVFWLSFAFSLILFIIFTIAPIRTVQDSSNSINSLKFIIFQILINIIEWGLLMVIGIFLANIGAGWFSICGIIIAIFSGFVLCALNETILTGFATLDKYYTKKNDYKYKYQQIKNQEL